MQWKIIIPKCYQVQYIKSKYTRTCKHAHANLLKKGVASPICQAYLPLQIGLALPTYVHTKCRGRNSALRAGCAARTSSQALGQRLNNKQIYTNIKIMKRRQIRSAVQTQPNMCLYPRFFLNPRYRVKKGKYDFGTLTDIRAKYVPVGCGNCIECRMQKSREWQTRLNEEIKNNKYAYFITLTFSNESLIEIANKIKCEEKDTNAAATYAVRLFLDRWRKKYGKSAKHWLITELGHENTERIHLHGILFTEETINNDILDRLWQYGRTDTGKYCNTQTINYIVKYVTKIDNDHKNFKPIILCSAGLGANYITKYTKKIHEFKEDKTNENYTLPDGRKIALPIYYRNKLWTPTQRTKLWLHRLDKNKRYVRGIEIDVSKTDKQYYDILKEQQADNIKLGYGSTDQKWQKEKYNITLKMLKKAKKT